MGGNRTMTILTMSLICINPRNGGAIAIWKAASGRGVISIPAMGGNSDLSATVVYRMSINPRDGGQ